jgi:hypothetical protein
VVSIADQIFKEIENLRLDGTRFSSAMQLAPLGI